MANPAMSRDVNILIVDDYEDLLESLRKNLELDGYAVDTALNGEKALALCEKTEYEIAVVDIMLPDINGYDLVLRMRELLPELNYIMMTGNASLESAVKYVGKRGILAYEIKPIDLNRLSTMLKEILARKKAERSLKESWERYRLLIEEAPFGICVITGEEIDFANRELLRICGLADTEIDTADGTGGSLDGKTKELLKRIVDSCLEGLNSETSLLISDAMGKPVNVRVKKSREWIPGKDDSDVIFIEDVTERERMRAQIIRSERNNLVAQLSMGLHHEIKNPLAIISGHSQTLRDTPGLEDSGDEDVYYSLDVIDKQVERIVGVLNDLAMLARESKSPRKNVSVDHLMQAIRNMFINKLNKNGIELHMDIQCRDAEIANADEGRLLQLCANVVMNSIQGMGKAGGDLRVNVQYLENEKAVEMSFVDNGTGIAEGDETRVFDPFFTSKKDGTGMGLYVCKSIVEEHEGTIKLENVTGGGVSVVVKLPAGKNG